MGAQRSRLNRFGILWLLASCAMGAAVLFMSSSGQAYYPSTSTTASSTTSTPPPPTTAPASCVDVNKPSEIDHSATVTADGIISFKYNVGDQSKPPQCGLNDVTVAWFAQTRPAVFGQIPSYSNGVTQDSPLDGCPETHESSATIQVKPHTLVVVFSSAYDCSNPQNHRGDIFAFQYEGEKAGDVIKVKWVSGDI